MSVSDRPQTRRPQSTVAAVTPAPTRAQRTWLAGPTSGVLLFFAFPPVERSFLVWVALVPLLSLVTSPSRPRTAYLSAWLGGLIFWVASLHWIMELHPAAWLAWMALALYQSVYWPLFLAAARLLVKRGIPLVAAAPVAWVACEYVQAHALSGFPWFYLAHSQYKALSLIQVSDLAGAWGVSLLIVLVNAWILVVARAAITHAANPRAIPKAVLWPTLATVAALGATLVYGSFRLSEAKHFQTGPRVLLLQSNMRQEMKMSLSADDIIRMFANLIRAAFEGEAAGGVDLVVWPETSYPTGWVRIEQNAGVPALEAAGRALVPQMTLRDWLDRRAEGRAELNAWSRELRCPMLVGLPTYTLTSAGGYKANGVAWIDGTGAEPAIYEKMHLVPFGEYIPFMDQMPWMKKLAPYDEDRVPKLRAGRAPVWFDHHNVRYAAAICFEDTLPHLVRRFYREAPDGKQPDILVNMSNDGWFNGSAEHEMHLAIGVFRCVENRTPLIRSANMGYTAIVDGNGDIVRALRKKTEATLTHRVPLDPRQSVYSQFGDWLPQLCLIGIGCAAVAAFIRRVRGRPA